MRPGLFYYLYVTVVLLVAALLSMCFAQPVLYPVPGNVTQTELHVHIGDLKKQSFNSSTDLLPLMQELLDCSGTIAVTLRRKDIESASSDLARYTSRYHDLQNLIIRLDMNESEISQFTRDAAEQKNLLAQFVSTSESLSSLEKLEIQYQQDEDPDSVARVRLQGKALKSRIQNLQNQYADVTDSLKFRGSSFGVNTDPVIQSRRELEEYTGMVAQRQGERDRQTRFADSQTPHISFLADPQNVSFHDSVMIYGFISGQQEGQWPVSIVLDHQPFLEITPDEIGEYKSSFPIHNISAGEHWIRAQWGMVLSEPVILQVHPLDTTITLHIQPVKGRSVVNLSGFLSAREKVPDTPVDIIVNSELYNTSFTDTTGSYHLTVPLSAGTTEIYTRFDNLSYPLNASESRHYFVTSDGKTITSVSTGPDSRFPPVLFILPVMGIFILPILYFRRKGILSGSGSQLQGYDDTNPRASPDEKEGIPNQTDGVSDSSFLASDQFMTNIRMHTLSDPGEQAHTIYLRLLSVLTSGFEKPFSLSATPREILGQISGIRCREKFWEFIEQYEQIRYGGEHDTIRQERMILAAEQVKDICRGKE